MFDYESSKWLNKDPTIDHVLLKPSNQSGSWYQEYLRVEKVDGPTNRLFRSFCDVYQSAFIACCQIHVWINLSLIPLPATYLGHLAFGARLIEL